MFPFNCENPPPWCFPVSDRPAPLPLSAGFQDTHQFYSILFQNQIPLFCVFRLQAQNRGISFLFGSLEGGHYFLKICSMGLPLASSSTSLSRYRISRISGSWISSTRTPHTVPVIRVRFGFMAGAF